MAALPVLYMRRTGPCGPDNTALMERFKTWLKAQRLLGPDTVILAVTLDDPAATAPRDCRYDVCTPCPAGMAGPADRADLRRLDGGTYTVFLIKHTAEAVERAWAERFSALAASGHRLDTSKPVMERYAPPLVARNLCELCVPIL